MADWKKSPKGMDITQLKSYKKELESGGHTGKEYGKVINLIKTLEPNKYGDADVSSAYKQLSSGVTTTGGWTEANLDNIEKYTGTRPQLTAPKTSEQLPSYLSSYQDSIYNASNSPELRDSIVNQIEPEGGQPDVYSAVETFEKMRNEMGVADIETSVNDLKAQLEEQYATRRARTQDAEGKPVAMGVIAGRVGEIERQENERIDAIGRQLNVMNDQLTTAYNVIGQYMDLYQTDYQNATERYNQEFNKNLQIYKLIDEEMDEQESTARANLQTYTNAITSGNLNYSSLSTSQKALINKLEVQARLPVGFVSSLKMNPKDQIFATSSDGSQVTIVDGNGNLQLINTGITPKGDGTYTTKASDKYLEDAKEILSEQDIAITGKFASTYKYGEPAGKDSADKKLSLEEMNAARDRIISLVGNEEEGRALFNRAMNAGGYTIWEG